ncbi:uncharacterized protein LOC143207221 [Lasioglossum baleicum]|uniref:uncharacterized protein LOC143207221 n=1 Tax=Lasioglossum baleicum TaxID=434251 RepID=UPI003FCC5F71
MNNCSSSDASHSKMPLNHDTAVQKRRSSVFYNRVIAFDQYEEDEKSLDNNDVKACVSETPQVEAFDLEQYICSLKNERTEWLKTLKQRRAERKSLTKQKLRLENEGQPVDLTALTDSEKAFVVARPNYQNIWKKNKKLRETTSKVLILNQMVYKLNQRFIFKMEKRLSKCTGKIIEMSES